MPGPCLACAAASRSTQAMSPTSAACGEGGEGEGGLGTEAQPRTSDDCTATGRPTLAATMASVSAKKKFGLVVPCCVHDCHSPGLPGEEGKKG